MFDHIEADRLGEGTALAHGDDITGLNIHEARRHVDGHVLKHLIQNIIPISITHIVALLETAVLLDEVQVIATNDNGTLHFELADDSGQNSATEVYVDLQSDVLDILPNADVTGEGALLVDVVTLLGGAWGLE